MSCRLVSVVGLWRSIETVRLEADGLYILEAGSINSTAQELNTLATRPPRNMHHAISEAEPFWAPGLLVSFEIG